MKKILVISLICGSLSLSANAADFGVKIFDIPMQRGALKEIKKNNAQRQNPVKNKVYTEPDISVVNVNGIYTIKIDTKALKGELKPYYVRDLTTNRDVYDETNARLVVNAGFFDPKNHQTVSYLTLDGKQILDPHNNKNLMDNKYLKPYMDKILNRTEFRILKSEVTNELKYDIAPHNDKIPEGYKLLHSIQGGPGLVPSLRLEEEFFVLTNKEGKIISQSASSLSKYARTLVGIKNNNVYFIIATTENPITLPEASDMLKNAGFEKAMAFDGGGSVSVDFRDKDLHIISDKDQTARKLKSFFIVTEEKTEKATEYYLQPTAQSFEVRNN